MGELKTPGSVTLSGHGAPSPPGMTMSDPATVLRGLRNGPPGWYAIRTRGRHEKKVRQELDRRGFVTFLPTAMRWSRWKDRTKRIEEPLFAGYCFAQFTNAEHALAVLHIPSAVQIIGGPQGPE